MAIVKFYNCDPKDAPRTTQGAHLGANAIITCGDKLLLEKRRDCELWGLVGGGVKNYETPLQAIVREVYEELGDASPASYAVRFAAGFENVAMVLSGMSSIAQVEDNVATMKHFKPLSEKEMARDPAISRSTWAETRASPVSSMPP